MSSHLNIQNKLRYEDPKGQYIEYDLISVNQNGNIFFTSVFSIKDIKDLFTISPAEYQIYDLSTKTDPSDPNFSDKFEDLRQNSTSGYQRLPDVKTRVMEIKDYIKIEDDYHIIPNSIILSLEADVIDFEELDYGMEYKIAYDPVKNKIRFHNSLYEDVKNMEGKPILVIDGNHRLEGIKDYYNETNNHYEFMATVLINIDTRDQAELFKTVNYKIKPVNKSYYYQIMGEFDLGMEEEVFLHYVTRYFNENQNSPYYSRIKMLGKSIKAPKKQTLSQSFFVEFLRNWLLEKRRHLRIPDDYKVTRIPVLRYLFINGKDYHGYIIQTLHYYFEAICILFNKRYEGNIKWDDYKENKLLRPTGVGAFIELFPHIYLHFLVQNNFLKNQLDAATIIEKFKNSIDEYLEPFFNMEYDLNQLIKDEYSSSSGEGIIKKLADELLDVWTDQFDDYGVSEYQYATWFVENVLNK